MKVLSKEEIEEVRSVIVLLKAIKRDLKDIDFSDAFLEGQLTVMQLHLRNKLAGPMLEQERLAQTG